MEYRKRKEDGIMEWWKDGKIQEKNREMDVSLG
jgi:hypothetical protein